MKYSINIIRGEARNKREFLAFKYKNLYAIGIACLPFILILLGIFASLISSNNILLEIKKDSEVTKEFFGGIDLSQIVLNQNDIELLLKVKEKEINWKNKLKLLGNGLPHGFTFSEIDFDGKRLRVKGYTLKNKSDRRLLNLNDYLNNLREDSSYANDLPITQLISGQKNTNKSIGYIDFEFASLLKK